MNNILVTGGAGYIGSHICKTLKENNYIPITLDNLSRGFQESVKYGPFFQGNISNLQILKEIRKSYPLNGVIHCAAFAYVGESVEKPDLYFENNFNETDKFLKNLFLTGGVPPLVFSSTCATYGIPQFTPINENHPQKPVNPYGETKLRVENVIKSLSIEQGFNYSLLRYFNAAGSEESGDIGENHRPETHLIPLAIKAVVDPDFTLKIFGDDYPTNDGTAIRDYIHVNDLASAHLKALEKIKLEERNLVLNLGTGIGSSVLEVVNTVSKVFAQKVKYEIVAKREGDPPILVADNKKAKKELGWGNDLRTLEESVENAVNYLRNKEIG